MGKKNKHRAHHSNRPHVSSPASPPASPPTPVGTPTFGVSSAFQQSLQQISALHVQAHDSSSVAERAEALPPTTPPPTDVQQALRKAQEAAELYHAKARTADRKAEEADKRSAAAAKSGEELKQERASLDALRAHVRQGERTLDERERAIDERDVGLLERDERLMQREAEAETGFLKRREAILAPLREEVARLTKEARDAQTELLKQHQAHQQELRSVREGHAAKLHEQEREHEERLTAARATVRKELEELEEKKRRLERLQQRLHEEQQDLAEEREYVNERARQRVAGDLERLEGEIHSLHDRLNAARRERERLERQLDERNTALEQFGDRSPEELLQELRALKRERDKLRDQVSQRPSADATARLRALEAERDAWDATRVQQLQEINELKQRLHRAGIAVTELESLRDRKDALDTQVTLLQTALRELKADVDKHITSTDGKSVFPACTSMDENLALHAEPDLDVDAPDLAAFVREVQTRIAADRDMPRQYGLRTLRSFLGGLAMSKLHLLQGISGTGKTSLPLAFARAIGGERAVTEVQSGWRDKADLIGHFNAFERRFYESEFLQALYRAHLPRYRDVPFIIVLDEMNLSHPEQYFASILSALENPERKQLPLMEASVEPAPAHLRDARILDLPDNVWFVGTANHDETTKDFADKTYDRAHVMELPRHFEDVPARTLPPRLPLAYSALSASFEAAVERHGAAADVAYNYLQSTLGTLLHERFDLNWGNRLQTQMARYVPVVIAAGGSLGEATDHVLATKVLRKIHNKFDVRPEDLIDLQRTLDATWSKLDARTSPEQSRATVARALQRLGVLPTVPA
ncbi:AAA family ATPase [Deinococcus yavapaiensis]|uniref:Dynein-related subfamily AAA family protein n=1 Tax=Deinococcus yavapaiensis KR-236 TaxID=694435 RepID=A0A318SN34_9DEIO|nr:AAA family ATPase [Deinococcus yavapaiensis]PYE54069.1 dynein-related subfamily AAA family protein [Deinococcus yavapaiensis KR-236]